MKKTLKKIAFKCLDGFTRTWAAFWATLAFTFIYCTWMLIRPKSFDPYPFMFLTMVVTMLSYYQNIVIMTIQKEDHEIQKLLEAKQAEMEKRQFDMIEDIYEEIVEDERETSEHGIERQAEHDLPTDSTSAAHQDGHK